MRFVLTDDVDDYARRTRELFSSRIEYHVQAGVLQGLIEGRHERAVLAYGLDEEGNLRFAALRTPPWPMLATELDPSDAAALIERWLEIDPELPGINGIPATARAVAMAWSELTGWPTRCRLHEAIHVLDRVSGGLRPAPGTLRAPQGHERPLVVDWMRAFASEAGTIPLDGVEAMADAALARGALMVWDDGGAVSMVTTSAPISSTVRVSLVYTPPEHRRRGYATNLVAAVSQRALSTDAERCMLYTDLTNPTSNKIYAEIGYRRVADWEEHVFELESGS